MKHDAVDRLLQLAFLEGVITTKGAYEKKVAGLPVEKPLPETSRVDLLRRLEEVLPIHAVSGPLTVGAFLKNLHSTGTQGEMFERIGLSRNIYRLLEQDSISPLKISAAIWRTFRSLFNLSTEDLIATIRRTHQTVLYRHSFKATLARYDAHKNSTMKASALEQAAKEMYAKATLPIPPDEAAKVDALCKDIAG